MGFVAAVGLWSDARLKGDPSALARVEIETFGGSLESARVLGPGGAVALAQAGGRLTPRQRIASGQVVTVEAVVRRPRWAGWLVGATRTERLTVRTPVASVTSSWLTAASGGRLQVPFSGPVAAVAYTAGDSGSRRLVRGSLTSISIATDAPAGSARVAVAARPWERLGTAVIVRWFPPARRPVVLADPAPGATLSPAATLRLTFSAPVAQALGTATPRLVPATRGRWRRTDGHTLVFTPSGFGAPLGGRLRVVFPHPVAASGPSGRAPRATREIAFTVRPPSTLRLQQLLADAGYLPVRWLPAAEPVARTPRAEAIAAVDPPAGRFVWRYPNVPPELRRLWTAGADGTITRGAVMMFQDEHHLAVDGIAGPSAWRALLDDAIKLRRRQSGYSYVYVHRDVPQLLTLWHNGYVVLTSPGNTGVPAAPTQLGTFPVFEHLAVARMKGTNPDGTRYDDPGVRWVSYFNGGDALHAFNRASFGTPQSLGCVELPTASAARLWPYTPIGTLVTIES